MNGLEFWVIWAFLSLLVLAAVRRWPLDAAPLPRTLGTHAAVAVGLAIAHNVIALALHALVLTMQDGASAGASFIRNASGTAFVWGVFTGVIFYAVVVMGYTALRFRRLYAAEQVSAAALEAALSRSQLEALRSQLRPHFLFNTLNAISVFVTEDAGKAQQMILKLSMLLRRSLDEEAHEVPLRQELAFVNDYLDIQRGRFGERLEVTLAVDPAVMEARVPVFLLQPLLENAIEHGTIEGQRTVVELGAILEHGELRMSVEDNGRGVGAGLTVREGIGLGNTRARLQHLYGAQARVEIHAAHRSTGSTGTRIDIVIPYRMAPA